MGSSKHHVWFIAILKEADPIEFPIALIGAKSLALDAQIRCYSLTKFAHNVANTPNYYSKFENGIDNSELRWLSSSTAFKRLSGTL
jgi:hypothetical protein